MAMKRGVSLYSYQQEQFFKRMTWKDMIKEVHDNLGTDGIEIIDEAIIKHYPFPSDEFIFDWNDYMARHEMKAVTMDVYFDVWQFRDHIMNYKEGAERLKNDIKIASRMGFQNVRALAGVPTEIIEMALDTAEKYNVRIGKEIHNPLPIFNGKRVKPTVGIGSIADYDSAQEIMDLRDRTGSDKVGLVPDFGIFQHSPSPLWIEYAKRHTDNPEVIDFILEHRFEIKEVGEMVRWVREKYPNHDLTDNTIERMSFHEMSADPEDLAQIVPYIVSIHGKFYNMTEIPGKSGQYEDVCIDYETPMRILRENGYNGYIDSEFEGQRDQQDRGKAYLVDEIEQVRRHHEMLKRLGCE